MHIVTPEGFDHWQDQLNIKCHEIVKEKRTVYTSGSPDVHRNFRVSAAMKGPKVTLGSELATHLIKQVGAVVNILCDPNTLDTERDNRFADLRNYIDLAYSAYKEGIVHATSEDQTAGQELPATAHNVSSVVKVKSLDELGQWSYTGPAEYLYNGDPVPRLRVEEGQRVSKRDLVAQPNVQSSADDQLQTKTHKVSDFGYR